MRVIFEEIDNEYYLEIILDLLELQVLSDSQELVEEFVWEASEIKSINIMVTKGSATCPSRKVNLKK